MQLTFLCSVHREWVYFHPQEALSNLDDTQDAGEIFIKQENWQQAMAYLGCAFETAEILLELQGTKKPFLVKRYTALALLLASVFKNLRAGDYEQLVLNQAQQILETLAEHSLGNKVHLSFIQEALFAVKQRHNQFGAVKMPANNLEMAALH